MAIKSAGRVLLAHCAYKVFKENDNIEIKSQAKFTQVLLKELEKYVSEEENISENVLKNYISRFKREHKEGREFGLLESNNKIPKAMARYLGYEDFYDFRSNYGKEENEEKEEIDIEEELQGLFDIKNRNIIRAKINATINVKSHPNRILELEGEYECFNLDKKRKDGKGHYLQISRFKIEPERTRFYYTNSSTGKQEHRSLGCYIPKDNATKVIFYSFDNDFLFFAQGYIASKRYPNIIRLVFISDFSSNDNAYASILILRKANTQTIELKRNFDIYDIPESSERSFYEKVSILLHKKSFINTKTNQESFEQIDIENFAPYSENFYKIAKSYVGKWFMYICKSGNEAYSKESSKYEIRGGAELGFIHQIFTTIYIDEITGHIKIKFTTREEEKMREYEGRLIEEEQTNSLNFLVHKVNDRTSFLAMFSFKISGAKDQYVNSISGGYIQTLREDITSGTSVLLMEKEEDESEAYKMMNPDDYKVKKIKEEYEKSENNKIPYETYEKRFDRDIKIIQYLAPLFRQSFNSLSTREIENLPKKHPLTGFYIVYSYLNYDIAIGKLQIFPYNYSIYETTTNEKLFGIVERDYTTQNYLIALGKANSENYMKHEMYAAFMFNVGRKYPTEEKIKEGKLIYTGVFTDNSESQSMSQIGAGRLIIMPVTKEIFKKTEVNASALNDDNLPEIIKDVLKTKVRNFIAFGSEIIQNIYDLEILKKVEVTNKKINYLESVYHSIVYFLSQEPPNFSSASAHAKKILKNKYKTKEELIAKLKEDFLKKNPKEDSKEDIKKKEVLTQFIGIVSIL